MQAVDYRREAAAGARAMAPWLVGLAPFGLVIGVSAAQADLPPLVGWLTGPLIYAGSAQIAAIQMLDSGAAPMLVITATVVINLRLALYSAAIAPYWRGTPLWWRLLGGYLLVDPSFSVGMQRYRDGNPDPRRGHAYYLGGAVLLWLTWLGAIALGAAAGARVPLGWHLEFVVPLYLIGQLGPQLRRTDRATRVAVAVASVAALLFLHAPMGLGIAIGIAAGIAAGAATTATAFTDRAYR